jgi:predicted transglutaminase-like cysteine proteinase
MTRSIVPCLLAGLLYPAATAQADYPLPDARIVERVRVEHGNAAAERLARWQALAQSLRALPETDKLARVNQFFNRIPQKEDEDHWGARDYWATPYELLITNGGDCEDYAIAKYFTLKLAGVPISKLRITYVRAHLAKTREVQSHMVLTYYVAPGADPLVLDNLIDDIRPAEQRTDLTPTYAFNAEGLWSAKQRAGGRLGDASQIQLWNDLLARIHREAQP